MVLATSMAVAATLSGTQDPDTIIGTPQSDRISGWAGNDTLAGRASGDVIIGDHGNDTIFGDDGGDTLTGREGFDTVRGGNGNDSINVEGDAERDYVYCNPGSDTARVSPNDFVDGTRADTLLDVLNPMTSCEVIFVGGIRVPPAL